MELLNDKVIKRFFKKIDIPDENLFGCWESTSNREKKEYGKINISGKSYSLHRISYLIWNKNFPNNLCCHTCDNPLCVNPLHLWDGTHEENMRDMVAKGRAKGMGKNGYNLDGRGVKNNSSKLTEEQVLSIRREYKGVPQKNNMSELAEKYMVSWSSISRIISRATWSHI